MFEGFMVVMKSRTRVDRHCTVLAGGFQVAGAEAVRLTSR